MESPSNLHLDNDLRRCWKWQFGGRKGIEERVQKTCDENVPYKLEEEKRFRERNRHSLLN
jgi:hypothetical protein